MTSSSSPALNIQQTIADFKTCPLDPVVEKRVQEEIKNLKDYEDDVDRPKEEMTDVKERVTEVENRQEVICRRVDEDEDIVMTHEIYLQNNKYRQWVKAGLGLGYLKEGLAPFCDHIGNQQHKDIINKIKQTKNPQPNVPCGVCNIKTLQPDHVQASKAKCPLMQDKCNCFSPNNKKPCPNNVCGAIYDIIIQNHASTPPAPYWRNSDAQAWSFDPWSICRCFINAPGYKDTTSAADTDCTGLLHVIINNKYFHNHIGCNVTGPNIFSKVRSFRNQIFHSSSMELMESEANCYIDDMITVLQDGKELKHNQAAQQAVERLQDLKCKNFNITTESFEEVLWQLRDEMKKVLKLTENAATKEDYDELTNKLINLETQMIKEKEEKQRQNEDYEKAKSDNVQTSRRRKPNYNINIKGGVRRITKNTSVQIGNLNIGTIIVNPNADKREQVAPKPEKNGLSEIDYSESNATAEECKSDTASGTDNSCM